MIHRKALGKGLSALLPDQGKMNAPRVSEIPLADIVANRYQPRLSFKDEALKELAASIKENGLIQPVIVHKVDNGYELIAGERRFRAAKMLGMAAIPAIIKSVQNAEALEMAIVENIQREELNPIEEAKAYKMLMDEFKLTQEMVAKKVGKQRPTVANTLRLLNLPRDIQADIETGRLTMGHARALLACDTEAAMMEMRTQILQLGLNVRDVESKTAKKRSAAAKTKIELDPNVRSFIDSLQKKLSTKVTLKPNRKGGGTLTFEYYNQDDLDRILEHLERI
ncbi:MAG: ParB/RepB/Spo0J family partition protein [Nitrospinae bacterium]|nr:ParB/RepB/Spo0J family partition protein [Nitrospinota bacterium]